MILGYTLILAATIGWGLSATWARYLITTGQADTVLLSQTRVTFAWAILALIILARRREAFKVPASHLPRFAILGIVGIAGANFFLYHAISQMNAALADLLQYLAPVMVVIWMWLRKLEPLDRPKLVALALSLCGCALALGLTHQALHAPLGGVISGVLSALCFATVLILGKRLSGEHHLLTYLHYSLLCAAIFWVFVHPPWSLADRIDGLRHLGTLILFSIGSILIPYLCFFAGLSRVPASRAGIVSTFEPVVVAIGSWVFLNETLSVSQWFGVVLVVAAIVIVELTSGRTREPEMINQTDGTVPPAT